MTGGTNDTKSVVDRSVVAILSKPDDTPSRRQGVSVQVERTHRLYGTSLLSAAVTLLKLNASTYATSCTIFHRFYHRVSLTQHCVWSAAMGSLLLATKVEDGPQQRTIRHILIVMDHLYRKRRGLLQNDQNKVLPLNKLGPIWKEWYDQIIQMENHILREMGFTFYFIPNAHPHKFVWEFLRVLLDLDKIDPTNLDQQDDKQKQHSELAQRVWNYCNDSCRLDLCVRFDPEVITCAAIHLAATDLKLTLLPTTWWELFLDNTINSKKDLATVANAILGIMEYEQNTPSHDKFLPSLVKGGSFNDPESFLWECRE